MKKKISTKLKILLCFGVILFTALGFSPTTASAHNSFAGSHEPSKVYDFDEPWDADYVGWFTHDKQVSPRATGIWYDRQAYVTTYSVPEHYVPADAYLVRDFGQTGPYAPECTESGMKDSFYLFEKWRVYDWATKVGVTPDNDGTLHVWVQPAIGTKTKKNGVWVDDGVTLMNLGAWEKAKTWGNSSTFASHYNKELKIKMGVPGGVTAKYQTLNAGAGYNGRQDILPNASYSYNVGSVHSYSETGIKSHIDWNVNSSNKRMVLVGVEVTKDSNSQTGTSGLLCSCISDSNRVEVGKSYNLWQDGLGDVGSHANSGYSFNKDRSDIYNFMVGQNFRCTFGTTVTYLYAEVDDICKLYQTMLYDGYDVLNQYGGVSTIHVGQTYNVNSVVPQQSSYKNAVWELVKAGFYKANGSNILTKPTVGVRNEVWGNSSYNFDLSSRSAWNKSVSDANKLYYTPTVRDDFEYMGTYQVRAPQIELCYYKDDLGRYHLFSATSGGKALNYSAGLIDQYKRNTWKNNGATISCTVSSILRNQPVTIDGASQKRNMVLTESYAYSANANNSVKEYNGSTNCWTDTSLPINGVTDSSSRFKAANSQDAYEIAIDKSGNVTRRTTKTTYGTTPTIFVAVYEGGPILTVKSYFTTDKVPNPSRIYYFEAPQSGEFTYGSETLKRGTNVQYPIGTTQVSVATACDQDGLGNADGSLIKKRADGVTVECRRTRFSTTNDLDTVNAVKKLTTTSRISQSGIEGVLPIWGTNWNGVINFKGGVAAMVKLYEADPVKGYWKVAYADLEDGDKEGSLYSQYKNTYYRLGRPKLIELNSATNGDAVQCEFLEHVLVADADNAINGDYTLVNVGTSKTAGAEKQHVQFTENGQTIDDYRDYSDGYISDIVNGKKTGYCNYAEQHYALQKLTGIEKQGNGLSIVWMLNPYAATSRDQLYFTKDSTSKWEAANASIDNSKVWMWGVYKPDKAIHRAYVLENTDDNSFDVISDYTNESLDVYTTQYDVSYEPFIMHNGKLLRLDRINVDNFASTPTLSSDTSSINKMAQSYPVTYNDDLEVNADSATGVLENTRQIRIQKKLCHVVGVYREYTAGDPNVTPPENTEEIVSFRDTDDMKEGNGSWSSAALELTRRARFVGKITNDKEWSSDPDYVAETAIPSSEFLRTDAYVPKYLVDIDYSKITTKVIYTIHCYQAVNAVETKKDAYNNTVKIYTGKAMIEDVPVTRTNYNYSLSGSNVWTPQDTTVRNYGLNESVNEQSTMFVANNGWDNDKLGFTVGQDEKDASFTYPDFTNNMEGLMVNYGVKYADVTNGTDSAIASVVNDWTSDATKQLHRDTAEGMVDPITASNQEVTFNNGEGKTETLLEHTLPTLVVADPIDTLDADTVEDNVFTSKNDNTKVSLGKDNKGKDVFQHDTTMLQIEDEKSNGLKKSQGSVHYTVAQTMCNGIHYGADGQLHTYANGTEVPKDVVDYTSSMIENGIVDGMTVNSVRIHTPVTTTFSLSEEDGWSQKINPGIGQTLVLDKPFTLTVSAEGSVNGNPGYGAKDYSRYVGKVSVNGEQYDDVQVKFPFQALCMKTDGSYVNVPANKWYTINLGTTQFMLPSWADEGDAQLIRVRTNAINARTNDKTLYNMELTANANIDAFNSSPDTLDQADADQVVWNYTSYTQQMVDVVGRVYGLSIIDIGDYPKWEDYFRTKGLLNGNRYTSGIADQNAFTLGITSKYTFPTVAGSHPSISNEGYTKPGYTVRYSLETVGNEYDANDYVQIKPTFYVVDEKGENRTPVNVYYDEIIANEKVQLVKVGSDLDKSNKKYLSLNCGDFNVSMDTLQKTAKILNYNTTEDFINHDSPVYTFDNIMLNQYVRTFVGTKHKTAVGTNKDGSAKYVNLWDLWNGITDPDKPAEDVVERSVQNWYGTYYLPSSVHVTTADDATVQEMCKDGVTYNEDCWIKSGYLIVNFEIKTVDGQTYHLAYNAAGLNPTDPDEEKVAGDCDMWSVEQFVKEKKATDGVDFNFEEGDFLVYNLSDSEKSNAKDDYTSGGTH